MRLPNFNSNNNISDILYTKHGMFVYVNRVKIMVRLPLLFTFQHIGVQRNNTINFFKYQIVRHCSEMLLLSILCNCIQATNIL